MRSLYHKRPLLSEKGEFSVGPGGEYYFKLTQISEKILEEKLSLEKIRDCHGSERRETAI